MWQAIQDLFDEFDVRIVDEFDSVDGSGRSRIVNKPNPAAQDFHDFEYAFLHWTPRWKQTTSMSCRR